MNFGYRLSKGIINWGYHIQIEQFIIDNLEDYQNLDNYYHWANKMTPEDREAKRHPNRSSRWIPNRIVQEKENLIMKLLDFLVGPNNYENPNRWRIDACSGCGVSQEDRMDFLETMNKCLSAKPDGPYFSETEKEDYLEIKDSCWHQTAKKFDNSVVKSMDIDIWEQGSSPMTVGHKYGFCSFCWRNINEEMKTLINDISGSV